MTHSTNHHPPIIKALLIDKKKLQNNASCLSLIDFPYKFHNIKPEKQLSISL